MKKTLEQQYKEETGLNAYEPNNMRPSIPKDIYVEWLEDKIEQSASCNVVEQSEQLKAEVFTLANKLAVGGEGDAAVSMHRIHNRL